MAGRQRVHTAEDIQKRRFAGAGLTHNDRDFPLVDGKGGVLQRVDLALAGAIRFRDVIERDKAFHNRPP